MARPADKLVEMLGDYSAEDVDEALSLIQDGPPVPQPSAYDIEVGDEVGIEEGALAFDDLAMIERIVGPSNLLPVHFLTEGAGLQGAIGKVVVSPPGWSGTGFMVSPTLLMTNNHVIRNTTDAGNAKVKFNFQVDHNGNVQQTDEYRADPASFFHTNPALDNTVVRLKPKTRIRRITAPSAAAEPSPESSAFEAMAYGDGGEQEARPPIVAPIVRPPMVWTIHAGSKWGYIPLPSSAVYASGQRLNVIQHPRGRRKEVALQSNTVTNIFSNHVRYSTDTEPGSSGSPVMNNAWDLVALHHAAGSQDGSGNWQDNQGVRVDKIVADLRSSLGGSAAGQAVLTELGI